jgi:hypothetical protein
VSGTADITNAVDTVITYQADGDIQNQSKIGVTKNRLTGRKAEGDRRIKVMYDPKSKRIYCKEEELQKVSECFVKKVKNEPINPIF